jgi:4-hydroxy-3-methylbut-2-enyl diphosphate reductase IspH
MSTPRCANADAERRGLRTADATCPLGGGGPREALEFATEGWVTMLIGSPNSWDSRRRLDLAHDRGAEAQLIDPASAGRGGG